MFRNYLVTAWRHIVGNPLFSFINIFGLTVALAACTLIILFVQQELSHDQQLPHGERIVRLHSAFRPPDAPPFLTVRSAGRMQQAVSGFAPDLVESGVRLLQVQPTVRRENSVFSEEVIFADGSFFDVFELPFVAGDADSAFGRPGDLIVSEATALKYFGRTDVVGEVLTVCCLADEALDVSISGVIQDLPATSHLDIDLLVRLEESMFDFAPNLLATWTSVNTYTYFRLQPGVEPAALTERIWRWMDTESPFLEMVGEGVKPTDMMQPRVMAVTDIYLHAGDDAGNLGDMRPLGNIDMIYAFVGVTALILVLAAVNFMNLSTARASQRAREVGLRKVLGASRRQVAQQFLGEALAITMLAMLLAMAVVELSLPAYNAAIGRQLEFSLGAQLPLAAALLGLAVAVGIVSGSYPALYLSRFLPARVLRASHGNDDRDSRSVRSFLVVFQFAVSIALCICTAVIVAQTHFARSTDLGFSTADKLVLHGLSASGVAAQREVLAERLRRLPAVNSVVLSSEVPSQDNENNTGFLLLDGATSSAAGEQVVLNYHNVGDGFFDAYQMEMLAGRGFANDYRADRVVPLEEGARGNGGVVLNASAVRRLGLASPEQAIGKTLRAELFGAGSYDLTVVGVVRDVYFRSLRFGVRATAYTQQPDRFREATLTFAPGSDVAALRDSVERVWKELAPLNPISQEFLNGMVEAQYTEEAQQASLFAAFSALAIIIACLGLYGLASFTAERRTREIGIRKVLGARSRDIVRLLVWQFSRPVLIANLLAWPVAWLLMRDWLENYEYRVGTPMLLAACLLAGGLSLLIAWSTVAGRALRVARANPVNALRYE